MILTRTPYIAGQCVRHRNHPVVESRPVILNLETNLRMFIDGFTVLTEGMQALEKESGDLRAQVLAGRQLAM